MLCFQVVGNQVWHELLGQSSAGGAARIRPCLDQHPVDTQADLRQNDRARRKLAAQREATRPHAPQDFLPRPVVVAQRGNFVMQCPPIVVRVCGRAAAFVRVSKRVVGRSANCVREGALWCVHAVCNDARRQNENDVRQVHFVSRHQLPANVDFDRGQGTLPVPARASTGRAKSQRWNEHTMRARHAIGICVLHTRRRTHARTYVPPNRRRDPSQTSTHNGGTSAVPCLPGPGGGGRFTFAARNSNNILVQQSPLAVRKQASNMYGGAVPVPTVRSGLRSFDHPCVFPTMQNHPLSQPHRQCKNQLPHQFKQCSCSSGI